jgi:hypothetical protein
MVDFADDDEPEPMRPMQIQIVELGNVAGDYVWELVSDSEPDNSGSAAPEEYADGTGLIGFNFPELFKVPTGRDSYSFPHLKLLQKMWPGVWKMQLRQLNLKAVAENTARHGAKNFREIRPVSEREWWTFIGILLSASSHGKGGGKLWETNSAHGGFFGMMEPINYGLSGTNAKNVVAEYRFRQIKSAFLWAFQDKTKADPEDEENYDPWNLVLLMVDGYNANRHDWVAASIRKVLDETMSAWCPQTTKTGGLPHLSFILRKPEPLGTEFKTIACTKTGE